MALFKPADAPPWLSQFRTSAQAELSRLDRGNVIALTASATIRPEHSLVTVDSTSGSVTVTLPAAYKCKGRAYVFKKLVAANSMILDGDGSETIDGATTKTTTAQWGAVQIFSDGSQWLTF